MSKILVIDDSISALQAVEMILADAGYHVHTCLGGRSALQALQQESFNLVITDIYMPDEDGLEVIRDSRRIRPNVPIVAMSGITGPRSMLRVAKFMGASETLQKPFSREELLAAVVVALGANSSGRPASSHTGSRTPSFSREQGAHE
jgi:DNA-binding NtrC family response regulator